MSLSSKLTIEDSNFTQNLTGKTVLIRVDFNVPQSKTDPNVITNPARIVAAIPTIEYLLDNGAGKLVLLSHLGRPDGRVQSKFSLSPVAEELRKQLPTKNIIFHNECIGKFTEEVIQNAPQGSIILLENVRFHAAEEGSSKDASTGEKIKASKEDISSFRDGLTKLGDIFVNDAFGTAHRAHSSVVGINLPIRAAGLLMKKELDYFAKILENPPKPMLGILGGAKVADKILLIKSMLEKVDYMIICGGMAFTFMKVMHNMKIGKSLYDEDGAKQVESILQKAKQENVQLVFPVDYLTADKFDKDAKVGHATLDSGIDDDLMALDCGQESNKLFKEFILKSKTILWNGPAGVFEFPNFAQGSAALLAACLEAEKAGSCVIVGGGDTATVVAEAKKENELSHVSTGGGASLELLEGKELPGVTALSNKD